MWSAIPNLDNPNRKLWFNPQAFQRVTCQISSRPDLCHLGSAGYDQMRGPGQRNLDFSMFKNFPIKERYNLQFRWEAFNFTIRRGLELRTGLASRTPTRSRRTAPVTARSGPFRHRCGECNSA